MRMGGEYQIVMQYHSNAVDIKVESTYICTEKMARRNYIKIL